jgi:dTDP-4-dehydrorhamnose 3,5-epimerase-like enzyme
MGIIKNDVIDLPVIKDDRGSLVYVEAGKNIDFEVKRVYYLFSNKADSIRGLHAHKKLSQLLIVTSGSCKVILDDGINKNEYFLNSPSQGLLISSNVWREMKEFSPDCVIMVLASEYYDEDDYIRDYKEFLEYIADKKNG